MRFAFDTTIDRGDHEIEVRVVYDVTPFVPARFYGDYPQPAEGGEVEIISVKHDGTDIVLDDDDEAKLLTECEERAQSDIAEEAEEAAEWRAQSRRDRLMEGF